MLLFNNSVFQNEGYIKKTIMNTSIHIVFVKKNSKIYGYGKLNKHE